MTEQAKSQESKVVLIQGENSNPCYGVGLAGYGTYQLFYGINRIPLEIWEKIEHHKGFMATLNKLKKRNDCEILEFTAKENHEEISSIKDQEKAQKLARFEFCASRIRRWLSSESRPEIRQLLDANLSFILTKNLEQETRMTVVTRFKSSFKQFENLRKQKKDQVKVAQEW